MKYHKLIFFILWLSLNAMLFSQEIADVNEINPKTELKIDLPLLDIPYQTDTMNAMGYGFFSTYSSPSMNQSMALTMDIYSAMHYGLKKFNDSLDIPQEWKNVIYYSGTAVGILAFAYVLPFGYPWMQEEYTRSLLTRYGINSFNGSYSFPGQGVTGITDNELSYLKASAPYDFIRINTVNLEGYILFSDLMSRKYFFYDLDDLSFVPALIAAYLNMSHTNIAVANKFDLINLDNEIKKNYENDKGQKNRFISGYNAVNWVYELFRPNRPYADRGTHPSGDGSVARYIKYSQLTDDERTYLVRQGWLTYLNFISPLLYGFKSIPLGKNGLEGNFASHHYPTSFGTDTVVQVFLKKNPFNMAFTFHNNINYENWFPAIEAELVDYSLNISKLEIFLSPRMLIGMQPKDQVFKTDSPEFLGLFGLRVDFKTHKNIFPYIDFIAKTKGWVAGNEYLNANASVRLGISLRF